MYTFISMLRGINVSGQKQVRMADLQNMYESLGFVNVRTYVQSGNVVFDSAKQDAAKLSKSIEVQIEATFGFSVPVLIRTADDLRRIKGTLAPWDPPQHLVVEGPYRYVRNPMHSGVFTTLYGEGLLFGSVPILIFVTVIFVFHWFYIPLMEERWLTEKFGEEYLIYKRNVPAWIPRLSAWRNNQ